MLNQCPAGIDFDVYQPRRPKASAYYRCVEDHFEPLVCSKCSGSGRIIAFIEDEQLVKKILKHLGLWEVKRKPPKTDTIFLS